MTTNLWVEQFWRDYKLQVGIDINIDISINIGISINISINMNININININVSTSININISSSSSNSVCTVDLMCVWVYFLSPQVILLSLIGCFTSLTQTQILSGEPFIPGALGDPHREGAFQCFRALLSRQC